MAHLYRLIVLALLCFCFSPGKALAITPTTGLEYRCTFMAEGSYLPSKDAVCSAFEAYRNSLSSLYTYSRSSASNDTTCRLHRTTVANGAVHTNNQACLYGSRPAAPSCPANSTLNESSTSCVCNTGFAENSLGDSCIPIPPPDCPAGQVRLNGICVPADCPPDTTRVNGVCVPDPDCPPGYTRVNGQCVKNRCPSKGSSAGEYVGTSTGTAFTCEPYANTLCGVKVEMDFCVVNGTVRSCQGQGEWTGSGCSAGTGDSPPSDPPSDPPTDPPTDPPADPPPESGDPEPPKPVDPTKPPLPPPQPQPEDPDGSCPAGTSKVNGACIKNPEPPNSEGECPSGSVKVGTECVYSSPAPGGPIIGDPGPGDPDPGSGGGTFAGNCETGFLCEGGDAIHCAIAREQHVRNCRLYDAQGNAKAVLYYAEDGKQGKQTGDLPGNDTVNVGPGSFDTSNVLGSAVGASDLTVVVAGTSVTLPLSKVNPILQVLGNLLLSISFLLAARIAARG